MTLKQQMKWQMKDILRLGTLPADSAEAKEMRRQLYANFTAQSAADIMGAKSDSPLHGESRVRKVWATLGYVFIVVFLASVAALVVGYWLFSDHRVDWLSRNMLFALLAAIAVEIGWMLLCANRVTALQNRYTERCIREIQEECASLPEGDLERFLSLLSRDFQRQDSDQPVGCVACGALFSSGEIGQSDDINLRCPHCGEQYRLVFGGGDAPLDGEILNRFQSFMEA